MSSSTDGPYLLGIDFGTGSCRAGVFDATGRCLAAEATAHATEHPRPGWAEQDPDEWWSALVQSVGQALRAAEVGGEYLKDNGYDIKDYGNGTDQDYPDVASRVAEAVANGEHDRALLVCGTGLGMAITANKIPGVRAVTAHDPYSAERARKSNDARVLAMGSRVFAPAAAEKVADHWLASDFEGGSSTEKVEKVNEVDAQFRDRSPNNP